MPVPAREAIRLKDPAQFRYIGKGELKIVDGPDIVTGKALYGIDTRLPGMLYAVVARPPVYGGKVKSFDAADALKVPGVVKVVPIDPSAAPPHFNPLGGVAVVAQNTWAAIQGRNALKIAWDDGPNASYDSAAYKAALEAGRAQAGQGRCATTATSPPRSATAATHGRGGVLPAAPRARDDGTARGHARASRRASARSGAASSRPRPRSDLVAKRLGMPAAGRHGARHAARRRLRAEVQARLRRRGGGAVARRWTGKPVKVTWTRDDDLHHDYFHTVSVEHLRSRARRAGAAGRVAAPQRRADDPVDLRRRTRSSRRTFELGMGVINVPFAIPNVRIETPEAVAHTRIGWFRSVSNIPHAFAVQSFVAETRRRRGARPEGLPARGHRAAARAQSTRRSATAGTTANRPSTTRSTPVACGAWSRRRRAKRAGAGRCRRAAASASPRTTVS